MAATSKSEEARVTVRFPADVYAQLQARGSHGQPLAAIVRQALVEYLARQPAEPQSFGDLAMTVAAMAAKLDGLQDQVEELAARLETLAASGLSPAATPPQPALPEQPLAADPSQVRTAGGQRKLTPRQQRALRDKHLSGVPVPALMEEYGLSRASVFRYLQSDKR